MQSRGPAKHLGLYKYSIHIYKDEYLEDEHDVNQVGRQYIEDTAEVQAAKARFFKFFQFAVDGLLYK